MVDGWNAACRATLDQRDGARQPARRPFRHGILQPGRDQPDAVEVDIRAGQQGEAEAAADRGEIALEPCQVFVMEAGLAQRVAHRQDRPFRRGPGAVTTRQVGQGYSAIIGDKEPTFGGDPGQQQDVWNVRSLRLRKALGL